MPFTFAIFKKLGIHGTYFCVSKWGKYKILIKDNKENINNGYSVFMNWKTEY